MVVRCTQRLFGLLDVAKAQTDPTADDWYANPVWIDRRKCLTLKFSVTEIAGLSRIAPTASRSVLAPCAGRW